MNPVFLIAFMVCLVSYIIHTVFHFFESSERENAGSKIVEVTNMIIVFAGYFAWILMIFSDPTKMEVNSFVAAPLGLLIGLTGFVMFILSTIAKKGFHELEHLVTKGIYSRVRHPMYLGTILIHIGFPIAARSLLTLISAIIWIPLILVWKYIEEKQLERKFGQEYLEYKNQTFF